ncbi:MAG: MFS transporter [Pseudonocardiaceae bacterium]|nr:MFS transporter [Pseudonocardiaceae bacterium]
MTVEPHTPAAKKARRVALASYIGTSIEWYDFFIYGIAATLVFRTQFFPEFSELGGTLAALGTFAVGFIARPVGGIVMGHFGDRVGRKSMLVVSLLTMGLATTLIGLLPTYQTIGVWAPILLVVLRLAQGAGVGGEWGGAVLMAIEHAPANRRSLYGCFPQLGLPSGILTSQLVFLGLTSFLPEEAFVAWGWRIAFLLSAALVIVGLVVRIAIEESAEFARVRSAGLVARMPVVEVFRRSWLQLLIGSLASIAAPTLGYLVSVYLVQYGTNELELATTTMLWILVGVSVGWILMVFIGGLAGDLLGRKKTFLIGATLAVVWAFPMFLLVDTRSIGLIVVALIVITTANAVMAGPQPALITEMFPIRLRYSGASICYQVGSIIGGGVVPIVATTVFARFGTSTAVAALIAGVSAVSLLAILLARRTVLRPAAASESIPETAAGVQKKAEPPVFD